MFSLAAFIGFLVTILLFYQHYIFCLIIIGVFFYLGLLEYNGHKNNRRDLSAYMVLGLISGCAFGLFTHQKFAPYRFEKSENRMYGAITGISENSIIVEVPDFTNKTVKIKLSKRGLAADNAKTAPTAGEFDPFLFDKINFSCASWRTKSAEGIYLTLEKLQGIHNVCKDGTIHFVEEKSITFNKIRRSIRNHVRKSLDLLGESSFARGFLLNDTSNINFVDLNLFRKMGIAHLFSASGLHMGLLYTTCFLPFSYLGFRKTGYSLALIICFIYLCVLDFSIPLLRSYIFLSLFIFLKILKRKTNGKYILYFSLIILEVIFPLSCFSPSFILSFLITLMILLYYPQFKKIIGLKNAYLKEHMALTVSASLGSCFLSIFLFNYYHPVSFVYNFVLVPFSGIYLASLFLYLILPVFKYIILFGDFIFNEACRIHYLTVEKYIPENHMMSVWFWLFIFFGLTISFMYYSFKQQYWYLRKYYMNAYFILSAAFFSNYFFIKIPVSSAMAFPYGIIQYKNHNYYLIGNIAEFSADNVKYAIQKLNLPFEEIHASDNFKSLLYEYKVHRKYLIKPVYTNPKVGRYSPVIRLDKECYYFISPKKNLTWAKNIHRQFSGCKNIHLVHSKKFIPDKESIKKLFSGVGLSENVHYMNYFTWTSVEEKNE